MDDRVVRMWATGGYDRPRPTHPDPRERRRQLREDAAHYSRRAGLLWGSDKDDAFYHLCAATVRLLWLADEYEGTDGEGRP